MSGGEGRLLHLTAIERGTSAKRALPRKPTSGYLSAHTGPPRVLSRQRDGCVLFSLAALRASKRVTVNDPDGARSYIVNGDNSILLPPTEERPLAAAVRSLWADAVRRRAIAERARAHAARHLVPADSAAKLAAPLHPLESRE